MIQVGDIWQDGRLLAQPDYFPVTFPHLEINSQTAIRIKAGLPLNGEYLLPFSEHPWHQHHTNAYCLAVEGPDCLIIIPCLELIRFYFGTCGILLKRLFTGPLQEETLWREKHFDEASGHLHLKLADGMPYYSVQDLARIALDSHALGAAACVYLSCLQASSDSNRYVYTTFPFVGKTTLSATGMWLPRGGKEKQTYLVFSLHACTHAFPFKSLSYDPCERASWFGGSSSGPDGGKPPRQAARSKKKVIEDSEPGDEKVRYHFFVEDSVHFPDLVRKNISVREMVAEATKATYRRKSDGSLELLAFGEGKGSGEARAIDLAREAPRLTPAPPEAKLPLFVSTGMTIAINRCQGDHRYVRAKPMLAPGQQDAVFLLPLVVDEDGVIEERLMFQEVDLHRRTRRACWVSLHREEEQLGECLIVEGQNQDSAPVLFDPGGYETQQVVTAVLWAMPQG